MGVGQPGEPPHLHAHGEILPLDMRRGNLLPLGVSLNRLLDRSGALSGAVADLRIIVGLAIKLDQHGVIDFAPKGVLDRREIGLVAVRGEAGRGALSGRRDRE